MSCPRCRTANPPHAKFCLECAAPLAAHCASCGAPLPTAAKFCVECAHPVGGAVVSPARFASPETYTPKHLVERILTSRAALEGERKLVTVLFADLKGSMELLADRDPEEARKLLDPVLEHMMEAVHRFEGTVNQVMGDGIMALFGAPLAHEDHAVRACYAALRMQQAVQRRAEELRREQGVAIRIRVGLHSGEVVVRAIGSDLHMDYTAVGQTTHLAARMEQLADPGSTFLTPETLALAEGFVQVTSLGLMAVKGLAAPIEVYRLAGAGALRSRLEVAAARGLSRFVGRDAEVAQLNRAIEQVEHGRGQVAAVVGEPGVGKSRLTFELTHSRRIAGWQILEAGAVAYGKVASYGPVIELLRGYFRIGDRGSAHEIRERVTGKILTLDRVLETALPALSALLGVPGDSQWQALDPPERRHETFEAVKRLLLREARRQPLLVVVEDLQWLDAETQGLLDILVESVPAARILLLVNYRPEYEHHWASKTFYTQVRLDPLLPASALTLLHGLLGEDGAVAALKSLLIERTGGNPFFLEESVRTLVETKVLMGERGAYRLATAIADIEVPPTVQAMLAARIDRLSPEDKRLLQSAAVIGKDVPFTLLAAIADEPEEAVRRGLARLQAAELLHEVRLFPDLEHTFKHALTHEVAYRGVLKERRRDLHAKTVEAMEDLYTDPLTEHVERLVEHAVRGEVWEKVADYAGRAGTQAADRSASAQAKAYFNTALYALGRVPVRRETIEQAIELRCLLTGSYFLLGEREAYLACMDEALGLAERLGDEERLARVLGIRTLAFWFAADNARALESGTRAVALADAVGHRVHQVHASLNLGVTCATVGEHARAVALFAKTVALLRDGLERERLGRTLYPVVLARNEMAASYAELGQFESAAATTQEAFRLAEALDHAGTVLSTRLDSCGNLLCRGEFHEAIPRLEAVVAALRDAGLLVWSTSGAALLGYSYAMTGRPREGVGLLRHALDQTVTGRRASEARFMAHLSEAQLRDGNVADARDRAEDAMRLSRQRGERGTEARVLHLFGEIAGEREPGAAEPHYAGALVLAQELGLRPLVARCHLGLATIYRKTGRQRQAGEASTIAIGLLRDMGMRYWLKRVEEEQGKSE